MTRKTTLKEVLAARIAENLEELTGRKLPRDLRENFRWGFAVSQLDQFERWLRDELTPEELQKLSSPESTKGD